jgi:hypothetical protein
MIGSLSTTKWVELNPSIAPPYAFKGSVYKIEDGLAKVPNPFVHNLTFNFGQATYERCFCSACFVSDSLNQTATPVATYNFYKAWCQLFKRLWFAGGLYIVFEVLALVCLGIMIAVMVMFFRKIWYFKTLFYAGGCMWASHTVAILGWIGVAKITFSDDCHDFFDGTSSPTLCAKHGPELGVFILALLPVVMIPFFVVACLAKPRLNSTQKTAAIGEATSRKGNEENGDEQKIPIAVVRKD